MDPQVEKHERHRTVINYRIGGFVYEHMNI